MLLGTHSSDWLRCLKLKYPLEMPVICIWSNHFHPLCIGAFAGVLLENKVIMKCNILVEYISVKLNQILIAT